MRVHDVLARQAALVRVVAHRVEDLGGDHHAVARTPKSFSARPEDLFADAERVHVRGIEEVDAQLERALDERARLLLFEHPLAPLLEP